jgi:hypothetical protein
MAQYKLKLCDTHVCVYLDHVGVRVRVCLFWVITCVFIWIMWVCVHVCVLFWVIMWVFIWIMCVCVCVRVCVCVFVLSCCKRQELSGRSTLGQGQDFSYVLFLYI